MRQPHIRIHHHHRGQMREVVALGNHLRTYQHIHLPRQHLVHQHSQLTRCRQSIAVRHRHPRLGHRRLHLLHHPAGAGTIGLQISATTLRAGIRVNLLIPTVVALQPPPMHHQRGIAARAVQPVATVTTHQQRRIAAPIQKHQRLLTPRQRGLQHRQHRWRQKRATGQFVRTQIHQLNLGQLPPHAGGQRQPIIFTLPRVLPAFQAGRSTGQQHRAVHVLGQGHRRIPSVVNKPLLLLIARVVLLIHHHQPQVLPGQKQRTARPHHHSCLPSGHRPPRARALHRRQATVPHQRCLAKMLGKPGNPLRRQGNFRHQHKRLGPTRQQPINGGKIHLRLATARHPIQQKHPEPLRRLHRLHRLHRRALRRIQRHLTPR